ncbi:MAG: tetratricopeptide repeat protein [Deltaproteobacteria bacterium]|nr:tetratricopeptide repeat protein [Deltaproteobacteria bacterium]
MTLIKKSFPLFLYLSIFGCSPAVMVPPANEPLDSIAWQSCATKATDREGRALIDDLTMDSKTLLCKAVVLAGDEKNIDEAIEMLDEAAVRDKLDHRAYYMAGRILATAGRYEEAFSYFRRSQKRYPQMEVPLLRLAKKVLDANGEDEALRFVEKACKSDNCSFDTNAFLASLYLKVQRVEDAEVLYKKMAKENPDSPIPYSGLAKMSNSTNDFKSEIEYLNSATNSKGFLELSNDNKASMYYSLAFACYNNEDYQQAKEAIDNALQLGDSASWYLLSGWIINNLGDPAMASIKFTRAIEIDKKLAPAYAGLGDTNLTLGQTKKAIDAYKQAIFYDPLNPIYKLKLAKSYAKDNNIEQAKTLLSDAIKTGKNNIPQDLIIEVSTAIANIPVSSPK